MAMVLFFLLYGEPIAELRPASALEEQSVTHDYPDSTPESTPQFAPVDSAQAQCPTTGFQAEGLDSLDVPQGLRLAVFAPHPDDETLAAGGLIQKVLQKGGEVRVVFVTNGDGYLEGVRQDVGRTQTWTSDFIDYGMERHQEALNAMLLLGLSPGDGLFFGFPDDGIDDLWADHWSIKRPYTSPYTRSDHPPYIESFSRWVKYAGVDLKDEVVETLCEFMPDWIVIPDPRDTHPDHCTVGVFVLDALRGLREEGEEAFVEAKVFTYLVHYPDYPTGPRWTEAIEDAGVGGSVSACGALSSTEWLKLPLNSEELGKKHKAIEAHHSQMQIMEDFINDFMLPLEFFCRLDGEHVMIVPHEYTAHFGNRS